MTTASNSFIRQHQLAYNAPKDMTNTAEASEEYAQLLQLDRIQALLNGDGSLDILLSRLKQSLSTGEEFARYVKKKAQIEDDHYSQLKKFASLTRASWKASTKLKNDSFSDRLDTIVEFDEKLFGVSSSYVAALNVMYDEVAALVTTVSRSRKLIKEEGKRREKDCADAILAADKAKQKYFHTCDDLEKLKLSDPNKKLFLKNKTYEQQEEELQRKVDVADQEFKSRSNACKKLKEEILMIHRPTNSKKLKNLILEMDIALNVQLLKYATWHETFVMNSGVLISPLHLSKPSMKSIAALVNNEKDLYDYLIKQERAPTNLVLVPVEYVVHPSLARNQKYNNKPFLNNGAPKSAGDGLRSTSASASNSASTHLKPSTFNTPANPNFIANNSSHSLVRDDTPAMVVPKFEQEALLPLPPSSSAPDSGPGYPVYSSLDPASNSLSAESDSSAQPQSSSQLTFGESIEQVIQFAGIDNVPCVVRTCIETVEAYGLDIEGIYRTSGNKTKVAALRESIDRNPLNYSLITDEIQPDNALDTDIYCAASLLKLYFACLPEPLLTAESCQQFVETVKSPDSLYIAKKLHHLVFSLPDGAYFTLRALMFHLNKVASHESTNRMNAKNLGIIWGPAVLNDECLDTLDLSYKSKVVEELMKISNDIFEADE